jgi:hypothetical protein
MNYTNNWKNKKARKRILLESFLAFLILLSPFIFKSHEYFPSQEGEVVDLWFFSLGPNGFSDVSIHVWFLLGKFIPLYLLLIWFFTCKHWWYHIILIPITMYSFQIFELYASEDLIVDSENTLWLLPICMIVIPVVYFIRIKLYDKHVHGIDLKAMNEELTVLREKEELRKEKEQLEKRKERLKNMGGIGVEAFDADEDIPAGATEEADELPIPTGNYELSTDLPEPIKEALESTKEVQNKTSFVAPVTTEENNDSEEAVESGAQVVITSSSKALRETRKERRQRLAREREQAQNQSDTEKSEKDHPEAKKM